MRLQQLQNSYLYEGLDRTSTNTMLLWESAGVKLREAALTSDQIQQIFAAVEKGATDAGSNRTMLGKGKDAASAVNQAWEDLKNNVYNSAPMANFATAYDSAVAKIETGLGGPNNAVNQVIQKYRAFAEKHPVIQGLIYSALIAAAGITGAGLGGAAVLGLFKLTDQLLQGKDIRSALYQGAKTGALAYGASKLGDMIRGGGVVSGDNAIDPSAQSATNAASSTASSSVASTASNAAGNSLSNQILDQSLENPAGRYAAKKAVAAALDSGDIGSSQAKELLKQIGSAAANPEAAERAITQTLQNVGSGAADVSKLAGKALRQEVEAIALKAAEDAIAGGVDPRSVNTIAGTVQGAIDQFGSAAGGKLAQQSIDGIAQKAAMIAGKAATESVNPRGKHLSEGQVYLVFNRVCSLNQSLLTEGVLKEAPLDALKGFAAKGIDKLKTVGKNLTTKITADKLNSAWQKAGAPMDSAELAKFLTAQGVNTQVVDTVYQSLKIPSASAVGDSNAGTTMSYAEVKTQISKLDKKGRQRLITYLNKQLGTV